MKILDIPQSGSVAGTTSSRNRFGQYRRTRAIPVNVNSDAQQAARARLSAQSAAWRALSEAERMGWATLGSQMTRTDALGQTYTLTGAQAYSSVNNLRNLVGDAVLAEAPEHDTPETLLTVTVTLTDVAFSVAYTPTPLGAGERALVFASPQVSAGRGFWADYRFILATAAAAASPSNVLAAYTAKFGVPVTGNKIFTAVHRYRGGFISGPVTVGQIIA